MTTIQTEYEIAKQIGEILQRFGMTVSTAESFTSGGIGSALTKVSGASNYMKGGLIAYHTEMKTRFLGVKQETVDTYDVVSEQVVREMIIGACEMFGTDFAIASTGYAEGGSELVEPNTRFVACGNKGKMYVMKLTHTEGDRSTHVTEGIRMALLNFKSYLLLL